MKTKISLALGCLLIISDARATDYTLTLYADGCSEPNTFVCQEGEQLSVEAVPMPHRHFVKWNDENTNNPRLVAMNQDLTYIATFAPDSFNISISMSPSAGGTVSGAGRYPYNASARLTATAQNGYKFSKWSDGNTNNPRNVVVTDNMELSAEFEKLTYSLVLRTSDNSMGTVSGAGTYEYGTQVQCEAIPNHGYEFVQWSDRSVENPRTVLVEEDIELTAEFQVFSAVYDVICTDKKSQKFLRDGVLYILTPNGTFDATGRRVEE